MTAEIQQGNLKELTSKEKEEIKNDFKKLDEQINESNELSKGEKLFYRILMDFTKQDAS